MRRVEAPRKGYLSTYQAMQEVSRDLSLNGTWQTLYEIHTAIEDGIIEVVDVSDAHGTRLQVSQFLDTVEVSREEREAVWDQYISDRQQKFFSQNEGTSLLTITVNHYTDTVDTEIAAAWLIDNAIRKGKLKVSQFVDGFEEVLEPFNWHKYCGPDLNLMAFHEACGQERSDFPLLQIERVVLERWKNETIRVNWSGSDGRVSLSELSALAEKKLRENDPEMCSQKELVGQLSRELGASEHLASRTLKSVIHQNSDFQSWSKPGRKRRPEN